jgi:hypothetical protein
MEKLNFTFKGFRLTNQNNNTHHLILVVANDISASVIYPEIATSTNLSISYIKQNEYIDLYINLNDSKRFFELNFDAND